MEWFEKLYTRKFIDLCGFANPEQTNSLPELRRMLHENGLEILEVWGDFTKEEYSVKSRRLITLSRKMEDGE